MINRSQYLPLVAVTITVILNIISAVSLKTLADIPHISLFVLLIAIIFLTAVNGARFIVWGYAHKNFPLSKSYPLTSIFFPLMLVISYIYGDIIEMKQILGTVLITTGVIWMTIRVK